MLIMMVCGLLLLAGFIPGVAWSGLTFEPPARAPAWSALEVARRFVWFASVGFTAGMLGGVAVIGGGGRLVMRLLAATGGDEARGRLTEADQVVGQITFGGTFEFILFNGVLGSLDPKQFDRYDNVNIPPGTASEACPGKGASPKRSGRVSATGSADIALDRHVRSPHVLDRFGGQDMSVPAQARTQSEGGRPRRADDPQVMELVRPLPAFLSLFA